MSQQSQDQQSLQSQVMKDYVAAKAKRPSDRTHYENELIREVEIWKALNG